MWNQSINQPTSHCYTLLVLSDTNQSINQSNADLNTFRTTSQSINQQSINNQSINHWVDCVFTLMTGFRHFFAHSNYSIKPFIFFIDLFCFKFPDLDSIKPSEHCACVTCGAKYCSGACQETAFRLYHKRMCHVPQSHHPLDLLRETWKQTHYPPEEFNVVAIAKLAAMFVSAAADAGELQKLSAALARFQSNVANVSEGIVHKMLGPHYQVRCCLHRRNIGIS